MASVVGICNLAMSRLGDSANISSIDPPESSPQAEYCAQFWPIARDAALEAFPWSFATRRVTLAEVATESSAWAYAYALPSNCLRVLAVQDFESGSDTGIDSASAVQQPFVVESLSSGAMAILTDQAQAAARYVVRVTDSTKYSPMFVDAVAWLLASHLAGPMIKGDAGAKMAQFCASAAETVISKAKASDASQRRGLYRHVPAWLASR